MRDPIPESVRRFILTSINSVPYLEGMLLLRGEPKRLWDSKQVAKRLYLSEKIAEQILGDLCEAGVIVRDADSAKYCYRPSSSDLRELIDQLAKIYARNVVAVTDLVHSNTAAKVQQFADAFKWRKDE